MKELVGRIVAWISREPDEEAGCFLYRAAGRGQILAVIDHPSHPQLLVQRIPREGDPEPPFMFALNPMEPDLIYYSKLSDEEAHYAWFMASPDRSPVVRLISKKGDPA